MVHFQALFLLLLLGYVTPSEAVKKPTCPRAYSKIGCYKAGYCQEALSKMHESFRHLIDWAKYPETLHSIVCRCAEKAVNLKLKYFAIRFYGECWGGSDVSTFVNKPDALSNKCIGNDYKECDDDSHEECAGSAESDYLYVLDPIIHGGWTPWKNASDCNKPCGGGVVKVIRTCTKPHPQNGGNDCKGESQMERACNTQPCPVDGGWSKWKVLTKCSKPCGGGFQMMIRYCNSPKPAHGGKPCVGKSKRRRPCNNKPCPVNGGWGKWKAITKCSKPCGGGFRILKRRCNKPKPAHGGKPCVGKSRKRQPCNKKPCPVIIWRKRICQHTRGRRIFCPYGQYIHVLMGYYGRTSSKFCGYKKEYNLKCKAKSSFKQIKQACQGQNSCFLLATDSIYGDPCKNTVKYLDIKYTCKSPKTKMAYVCDGRRPKVISCPKGKVIKVGYAYFGRRSKNWCSAGKGKNNKECYSNAAGRKLRKQCNNKRSCKLSANRKMYRLSCLASSGYLYVNYKCIPRPKMVRFACESKKLKLKCPPKFKIYVTSANYGRLSKAYCRKGNYYGWNCKGKQSLKKVRSMCNGKRSCTIRANNNTFGDPCPGTTKYLQIEYQCLP